MDIVIKSFRRPFYLDRLLYSINKFCTGFDKIIISDGGTELHHIKKLDNKYPGIVWEISKSKDKKIKKSNFVNGNELIFTDIDRLTLWRNTVKKVNSDFFLLLEDDCWLTEFIDLIELSKMLTRNKSHFCKLWYANSEDQRYSATSSLINIHANELFPDILEYTPRLSCINSLYNYFIMGQAIFSKNYYLAATKNAYVEDETDQILKAYQYLKDHESSTPRSFQSLNRIAYQGWAVSIRSDDIFLIESGFSGFSLSDALNELWYENKFNSIENFPFDFSISAITEKLKTKNINNKIIESYKKWRAGCSINPNNNLL